MRAPSSAVDEPPFRAAAPAAGGFGLACGAPGCFAGQPARAPLSASIGSTFGIRIGLMLAKGSAGWSRPAVGRRRGRQRYRRVLLLQPRFELLIPQHDPFSLDESDIVSEKIQELRLKDPAVTVDY